MKTTEIDRFSPCDEAVEYRNSKPSFEEAWKDCPRGDWMLWIASKLGVDHRTLTLAKAKCANTVRHLMKDPRSTHAVDVAIAYGEGKVTVEELSNAAAAAYFAATDADAATYAAYAAYAADVAYADVAYAADAAAYSAYSAYAAATVSYAALTKNQMQTADICREVLTESVLDALKKIDR